MVEINPLVKTEDDEMIALDSKISFDENAEFRHKEWSELRDLSEEEEVEIAPKKPVFHTSNWTEISAA